MPAINKISLARDEIARVEELHKTWNTDGKLSPTKLFRFRSVVNALDLEKVSLSGSFTHLGGTPGHSDGA